MKKITLLLTLSLAFFILWAIKMANTGESSNLIYLVYAIPHGDKIAHLLLFGLLSFGVNATTRYKLIKITNFKIYLGTLLVFLFALLEELSQYFIPTRSLDIFDLIANIIGISVFTFVSHYFHKKQILKLTT